MSYHSTTIWVPRFGANRVPFYQLPEIERRLFLATNTMEIVDGICPASRRFLRIGDHSLLAEYPHLALSFETRVPNSSPVASYQQLWVIRNWQEHSPGWLLQLVQLIQEVGEYKLTEGHSFSRHDRYKWGIFASLRPTWRAMRLKGGLEIEIC